MSQKLHAPTTIFKMDLHVLLPVLPHILRSPQCSSTSIGSKLNNWFNIWSSPFTQPPPHNRTKVHPQAHKYQTSQQNPLLRSSVSFPSTCFHQAPPVFVCFFPPVCRSINPQLLSPLMELSTNKSKILRSGHTPLQDSHQLYSFPPLQSTLFLAISFFRALKPTSLLFPTLHKFPALPFLPAPFPTGQF